MYVKQIVCALLVAMTCGAATFPPLQGEDLEAARKLYEEKNYREAESKLQEMLRGDPDNAQANYLLGMSLLELKKSAEAEAALLKAEAATPQSDEIQVGLARVYIDKKELDKAKSALDKAQRIRPDNPEAAYQRGMLDAHNRDYASAAGNMERAIKLNPRNAYAHYYAGIAYNQIKKPDKMVEHFQAFLKLMPNAPEADKVRSLLRGLR